jgi:hypothetical protein
VRVSSGSHVARAAAAAIASRDEAAVVLAAAAGRFGPRARSVFMSRVLDK